MSSSTDQFINAEEFIELEVLAKLLAQPEIHEIASRAMANEEISREEFFRQTALGIRAAYRTMAQELMKAQEREQSHSKHERHRQMSEASAQVFAWLIQDISERPAPQGVSAQTWQQCVAELQGCAHEMTCRHRTIAEKQESESA